MSDPYIVAHDLGKSFAGKAVLAGASFEVGPGDVVGVLGKNRLAAERLTEAACGDVRTAHRSSPKHRVRL